MQSASAQEQSSQQQAVEEITVTGSRIVRRDLESSSPIITVGTEQLENTSQVGIEATLNSMPQFVAGDTQYDTSTTEPSAFVTPGIASLNLRGLGVNRNLVLIDGRRAQPANALLIVDINTIPSAAVERVETITGGASAVYGADALAGVVNFVLKDDFEGVSLDVQTGQTLEGDGSESKFSALIGMNAADDRGNVMFGVDWTRREAVMQKDRDWKAAGWFDNNSISGGFLQTPGYRAGAAADARFPTVQSNPPSQAAMDAVWAKYLPNFDPTGTPCTGANPVSACRRVSNTAEVFWNPDGTPFLQNGLNYRGPFMATELDGQGYTGVKGRPDGFLEQVGAMEQLLSIPLDRTSAFGRAVYDINDNLQAFAQANYSAVDTSQVAGYIPAITVWQAVIPNDGRAIPADLQALLNSRTVRTNASGPIPNTGPTAPWVLYRGLDYLGNERSTNETQMYQTMFGVEGSFPGNDWTYEAYVSTGHTTNLYLGFNGSQQRYQSLVSAPNWGTDGTGPTGLPVPAFTFGAGYAQNCSTGLPTFGGEWPAANCIEAIQSKMKALTEVEQDILEFNLQGKIADMGAGELRFAAGVSGRRNSFLFEPSEINDNVSVIEQPQGIFVANNARAKPRSKRSTASCWFPWLSGSTSSSATATRTMTRPAVEIPGRRCSTSPRPTLSTFEAVSNSRRAHRTWPSSMRTPQLRPWPSRPAILAPTRRWCRGATSLQTRIDCKCRRFAPPSLATRRRTSVLRAARRRTTMPDRAARSSRSRTKMSRAIRTSCRKKPRPGRSASY